MRYLISLGLVLAGVWYVWSGHTSPLLLSLGGLSLLVVVGLASRMGLGDSEGVPIHLTLRALIYAPWLMWEIFKSNLAVGQGA